MDRRIVVKNLDYVFLASVLGILTMSLFVLSSATLNVSHDPYYIVKKQALWIFSGFCAMIFMMLFDYNSLKSFFKFLYIGMVLVLTAVLLIGKQSSWFEIGPFLLQPSEFAKVIIIITFAKYLSDRHGRLNTFRELIPCFLHVGVPMLLIVSGDLGTSLVFIAILFGMLFVAGANPRLLVAIIAAGAFIVSGILFAHFKLGLSLPLEDYQLMRLVVFLNPYNDGFNGRGAGYHVIQSQVAIGSGGL